jgi:hypothetical protein
VSQHPLIQTKLAINQPGDEYEQEADRVAEQVMRMTDPVLQRKCAKCNGDDEKILQAKELPGQVAVTQNQYIPSTIDEMLRLPGQKPDEEKRAFVEPRFGYDFNGVPINADALKSFMLSFPRALVPTMQHATRLFHKSLSLSQKPGEKDDLQKHHMKGLAQDITPPSGKGFIEVPPTFPRTCEVGRSESNCFPDIGEYIPLIRNDCCTKPCSIEHEDQHVRDFGLCCKAFSQALKKPGADVLTLFNEWHSWKEQVEPISECRAYMNDISCAQRLAIIKGCTPETEPGDRSNILASEGMDAVGEYEETFEGTAQQSTSSMNQLLNSGPKPLKGMKELDACCIDITWYEQTFAGEAAKWCARASGRAIPQCPFTVKPKKR